MGGEKLVEGDTVSLWKSAKKRAIGDQLPLHKKDAHSPSKKPVSYSPAKVHSSLGGSLSAGDAGGAGA